MSERKPFSEIARALAEDPEYRKALTARLQARTVDADIMDRPIAYTRGQSAELIALAPQPE